MRSRPDENGVSPFSAVFGEQPFMPRVIVENKERTQLTNELEKPEGYYRVPRTQERKSQIPSELLSCSHVWLRLTELRDL